MTKMWIYLPKNWIHLVKNMNQWQLFCGNDNEFAASVKAVKLLTSVKTNAHSLQEKYVLWFLCLRPAGLVIMSTQITITLLLHSQIHQCSKEIKTEF